MSNTKYEKQYNEMMLANKSLFEELKSLSFNPASEEFKELQRKLIRIIKKAEDRLCAKTESARYGSFSNNLADKFWEKIRQNYPEIDFCE